VDFVEKLLLPFGWIHSSVKRFWNQWVPVRPIDRLSHLLSQYSISDELSETLLYAKICDFAIGSGLSTYEYQCFGRLREIAELRRLCFGRPLRGTDELRRGFAYAVNRRIERSVPVFTVEELSVEAIQESAEKVSSLYRKLYATCMGDFPELIDVARRLTKEIFAESFDGKRTGWRVEELVESMTHRDGIPFLVLNLLRKGDSYNARAVTQYLLTSQVEMDEDVRSALYWMSEIHWFSEEFGQTPIRDFETSLRYLYHACFTSPERAGFLEIDSQYFSQFEALNELAREGFLYREGLVDKILNLWRDQEGMFDLVFQNVLERMTERKSKIYDERSNWERFWKREKENYSREYLYLIEGNLCYANKDFEGAVSCYHQALELNPSLRGALLNLLFAYIQTKQFDLHTRLVERIIDNSTLFPANLYCVGNSYLLAGEKEKTRRFYELLKGVPGWENKVEYYQATFCYEHALYPEALHFAKLAHEKNPTDSAMSYHLSLCYNALGEKDRALDMVKKVDGTLQTQWLKFYRFTLERDSGRHIDASQTLLAIPPDYFQDPEELKAALDFAKEQKNFTLLRHLRSARS